jgi:hypothetical protein
MDVGNERALKRATIVEKWCHNKIEKTVKKSEVLRKELRPGEVDEGKKEELRNMRIKGRQVSQILNKKKVQREIIPQEGGQEEEWVEERDDKSSMDLA